MKLVTEESGSLGIEPVCRAIGLPRSTYYRRRKPVHGPAERRGHPRGLSPNEKAEVLEVLHEERFADLAPAEVYATLLEEGRYLCSIRTMYRILAENSEVRERRNQLRHPTYAAPELLATRPNELWSWDITKLRGPAKWTYYYLYKVMDVYSRKVVGWMIAHRESSTLAKKLIATCYEREGIQPGQLTIHADRGSSMMSKPLAFLMADLGITKSHSRPHVSNDNPFSESAFKTMKYHPGYPARFGSIEDARGYFADLLYWYNEEHHHSGINLLTPSDLHHGRAEERLKTRDAVLAAAYAARPERFVHGRPSAGQVPAAVWINKPASLDEEKEAGQKT